MGEKDLTDVVTFDKLTGKVEFNDHTLFMGMTQPFIFRKGESIIFPPDEEMAVILEMTYGVPSDKLRRLEF